MKILHILLIANLVWLYGKGILLMPWWLLIILIVCEWTIDLIFKSILEIVKGLAKNE